MTAKIPATIITGFLGSGKTTLIRHLLQNAGGKRIALIINEFGDLGVDSEILKGCGDETCRDEDVVELSNGCICCTVAEDFIPTLEMLINREDAPDHIVIETSGLALPQPLVRAFNWPEIRTRVTVDGVVTVVDGPAVRDGQFASDVAAVDRQRAEDDNLEHETPLSELFEDQIACADMVLINKSDLLSEAENTTLTTSLTGQLRDGVRVLHTIQGEIDPAVLLGLGIGAETDLNARHEVHHHHHDEAGDDHHHHEHGHDAFESFVLDLPELTDAKAFIARLPEVIRDQKILRLKGFAAVAGKPLSLTIQAVGPRVDSYFEKPTTDRTTRLVVIGEAGLDRAAIAAALT